jgi:hypothetical protein
MDAIALEHTSEAADNLWDRRVFPPCELDRAVEEYNAIHNAANRLFRDRCLPACLPACLPVGRLELIHRDWYAAGELASCARRLADFLAEQRLLLLADQRRLLQPSE